MPASPEWRQGDFVNLKDENGTTALHVACEQKSLDKVVLLIKNGAEAHTNAKKKNPPVADIMISLINSNKDEDTDILRQLMKGPAISDFLNLKDKNGTTALHAACEQNSLEKILLLSENGARAQANAKGEMPQSDIMISLINSDKQEDADIFRKMVEGPATSNFTNLTDKRGTTPLQVTCQKNLFPQAKLLIKNGATAHSLINDNDISLEKILDVLKKDEEIFSEFINKPNSNQVSPFQLACANNDDWKAILLFAAGAKISKKDIKSKECLMKHVYMHLAVGYQHVLEYPELATLMKDWNAAENKGKEEAEKKINDVFSDDVQVIFAPTFNFEDTKKWKEGHTKKGEVEL